MPTFNEFISAVNAGLPDTGHEITAGDLRQLFTLSASLAAGVQSITQTVTVGGSSVTDSRAIGRTVSAVMINDTPKNTGFDQPNGSGAIAFTDGTTVSADDVVTIFFS